MPHVFIILLTYTVPLERIMQTVPEHREYLNAYYEREDILLSGIQEPPTGGVIVMRADDQEEVQQLIQNDPFFQQNLATYQIIELEVRRHQLLVDQWLTGFLTSPSKPRNS